jgi:hypothetical protein
MLRSKIVRLKMMVEQTGASNVRMNLSGTEVVAENVESEDVLNAFRLLSWKRHTQIVLPVKMKWH